MTSCAEIAPLVVARPLELLEPADRVRLDEHLAGCEPCRALADDAAAALEAAALPGDAKAPTDAWERLEAALGRPAPALRVALCCSFCHDDLARPEAVYCAACLAPHHADCFREHGECSTPGCGERRAVQAVPLAPAPRRRRSRALWAGVLVCGAVGGAAALDAPWGPGAPPSAGEASAALPLRVAARPDGRLDVVASGADLREVLLAIGRAAGVNLVVAPEVKGRTELDLHGVSWREALDLAARQGRCELEERPGGIYATQPPRVTARYQDRPVEEVLQDLARRGGCTILIGPGVEGRVTVDFVDVHWRRALFAVVRTAGDCEVVEEDERLLRVVRADTIEAQLVTHLRPLRHLDLAAGRALHRRLVVELERQEAGEGAAVRHDERHNALVLTAPRPALNALLAEVQRRDVPAAPPPPPPRGEVHVLRDPPGSVIVAARQAPVRAVLEELARTTGRDIRVEASVTGTVDLALEPLPWDEATRQVAAAGGCVVTAHPGQVLEVSMPWRVVRSYVSTQVGPLLSELAGRGGRRVELPPDLQGVLEVSFEGEHWLVALSLVARAHGLEVLPGEETVRLVRRDPARPPVEVEVVVPPRLTGAEGQALARELAGALDADERARGATALFDAPARALLLAGSPAALQFLTGAVADRHGRLDGPVTPGSRSAWSALEAEAERLAWVERRFEAAARRYRAVLDDPIRTADHAAAQRDLERLAPLLRLHEDVVVLPAGTYRVGREDGAASGQTLAGEHALARPLRVDRLEVRVADYQRFLATLPDGKPGGDGRPGYLARRHAPGPFCVPGEPAAEHGHAPPYLLAPDAAAPAFSPDVDPACPVVEVSWWDAQAFARWAGKRLPTMAEWEVAAGWDLAAGQQRVYPWGDAFERERLACAHEYDRWDPLPPAGSHPGSAASCGALDLAGSVREWCSDWTWFAGPAGPGEPPTRRHLGVIRGGGFRDWYPEVFRASGRDFLEPAERRPDVGFRCVSDEEPAAPGAAAGAPLEDGRLPWSYYLYRGVMALQATPADLDGALEALNRAVELAPRMRDPYFYRACAGHDAHRMREAIEDARRAAALPGNVPDCDVQLVLGQALFHTEQWGEAATAYEAYLRLAPPGAVARQKAEERLTHCREQLERRR